MKDKILITRPIWKDVVERLEEFFDVEVNLGEKYSREQLMQAMQGKAGVLVAMGERIDETVVKSATGLRAICVSAAGYNNLDLSALTKAGVIATNAPGPTNETVADYAWGLMIATARRLTEGERWLREGNWKVAAMGRFFGSDLHGKTLGIIGMGRIGQAIARRGLGFDMRIIYHNRKRLDPMLEQECRARYVSKTELLNQSDQVMLSLPYSNENHHIIGAVELKQMKPTAFLINIARGGLIDEAALADALSKNQIAGAGLDVFEGEPVIYPGLLSLPNVVLTPHIAGATEKAQHDLAMLAAENLIAALGKGPSAFHPPSILNPSVLT
jgi:glyoxylate/hydroxypyruvate/2-ketogluconate reductase